MLWIISEMSGHFSCKTSMKLFKRLNICVCQHIIYCEMVKGYIYFALNIPVLCATELLQPSTQTVVGSLDMEVSFMHKIEWEYMWLPDSSSSSTVVAAELSEHCFTIWACLCNLCSGLLACTTTIHHITTSQHHNNITTIHRHKLTKSQTLL